MDDSSEPPSIDRVIEFLEGNAGDKARARLEALQTHPVDDRKAALRSLRTVADDRPAMVGPLCAALPSFLVDEERSVRLSTAKLFVTIAARDAERVVPVVDSLAARLADDEEFYYVRARCAEALGHVALDHPGAVASPEVLADLRIGLSFDEPEVRAKLAKALECVALGDPGRLRHQVSTLADHLDDENELVRYHLATALVAVGCEYPERLVDTRAAFVRRLEDENAYVRGRAAEAFGVFASETADEELPPATALPELDEANHDEPFFRHRIRFVVEALPGAATSSDIPDSVGTLEGIRRTTDEAVEAITSPDGDGECPHCGLSLPENGPPMCPRCGAPY